MGILKSENPTRADEDKLARGRVLLSLPGSCAGRVIEIVHCGTVHTRDSRRTTAGDEKESCLTGGPVR